MSFAFTFGSTAVPLHGLPFVICTHEIPTERISPTHSTLVAPLVSCGPWMSIVLLPRFPTIAITSLIEDGNANVAPSNAAIVAVMATLPRMAKGSEIPKFSSLRGDDIFIT